MAHGPRRVITINDERGRKQVTVSMAFGLSVKWQVTADGETVFYVDREGETPETKGHASAATGSQPQSGDAQGQTIEIARSDNGNGQPEVTMKRKRGRPRIRPVEPARPGTFGDQIRESLEMANK